MKSRDVKFMNGEGYFRMERGDMATAVVADQAAAALAPWHPAPLYYGARLRVWLGSLSRSLRGGGQSRLDAPAYEYSQATHFPHAFDITGATRWQLALGLLGLRGLARWQQRRREAVQRGRVKPVGPSVGSSSPYVLVGADDPGLQRRKPPYALAGAPAQSLLPALQVRHNKGFDDR